MKIEASSTESFWRHSAPGPGWINNKMNPGVKLASHTQKVPHMGLPQNPPVTRVDNVKKAPIFRPVPEKRGSWALYTYVTPPYKL